MPRPRWLPSVPRPSVRALVMAALCAYLALVLHGAYIVVQWALATIAP